jgi:hypothetical protein
MQMPASIANETEFLEWLASILELERQRLRDAPAAVESHKYPSFEVANEKCNEGDTAS